MITRTSIKVLKHEFVGKLFEHGICNGTIGVITKVIDDDNVEITFPTNGNTTY